VLVLATATLLAVVGMGAIAVTRLQIRRDSSQRDMDKASRLAVSAVHAALGYANNDPSWRGTLEGSKTPSAFDLDSGRAFWAIQEPDGSPLAKRDPAPVRIVALGESGSARRVYSVTASPPAIGTLDALRCALHARGNIATLLTNTVSGVLSSDGSIVNTGTLTANIEAQSFQNRATHSGTIVEPAAEKLLPGASSVLNALAVTIPYSSLSSGDMRNALLTSANNPYGLASAAGVYAISVPGGRTLKIRDCRIKATLLVTLGVGATLDVTTSVLWQPPATNQPSLILDSESGAVVIFESDSSTPLSEGSTGVNFNPLLSPYAASSDTDKTDSYPSELIGLFDLRGPASLTIQNKQRIVGSVVVEGTVRLNQARLVSDPAIFADPPTGYTGQPDRLSIDRGSWKWESYEEFATVFSP
jgi:hypothetical protein